LQAGIMAAQFLCASLHRHHLRLLKQQLMDKF
jgi:hypothetical protein